MTEIEHIERQMQKLSASDLAKFREWFHEYEWQAWDAQLETDINAGRLKSLAGKALADHAAGRTSRI